MTPGFDGPEWSEIRLDIDASVSPDVIGAMTDMSVVNTGSVNAVFSSHNIEHLYPHEVPIALGEFKRVLADNGYVVITCPDLLSVAQFIAGRGLGETAYVSSMGPITPLDMLYGHQGSMGAGNLYMSHRCGFTAQTLLETLQRAGFGKITVVGRKSQFVLWAVASKAVCDDATITALAQKHIPNFPRQSSPAQTPAAQAASTAPPQTEPAVLRPLTPPRSSQAASKAGDKRRR